MIRLLITLAMAIISFYDCFGQKIEKGEVINLSNWEFKIISQGNNNPTFEASKDSIQFIPILLKSGYSLSQIQTNFGWSEEKLTNKCNLLLENSFLKKVGNEYTPSLMIISNKEANIIREKLAPLASEITTTITDQLDSIIIKTKEIRCLNKFKFDDISLLILSNVLLDNGQIRNVEKEYLKSERPRRNDKNYYAAYGEKPDNPQYEAWNVYGNQVDMNNGFAICRYGNQRYTEKVLELNEAILKQYIKLQNKEDFSYPIVNNGCNLEIMELANRFKPYLIKILNKHSSLLKVLYKDMNYAKEVTYEEFFIWIYHILYSDVTDRLLEINLIKIPDEKVSFYIVEF